MVCSCEQDCAEQPQVLRALELMRDNDIERFKSALWATPLENVDRALVVAQPVHCQAQQLNHVGKTSDKCASGQRTRASVTKMRLTYWFLL